jgi:hypothetical protein
VIVGDGDGEAEGETVGEADGATAGFTGVAEGVLLSLLPQERSPAYNAAVVTPMRAIFKTSRLLAREEVFIPHVSATRGPIIT